MPSVAAFRHDPVKLVLPGGAAGRWHWDHEPIVSGHRRITYDNPKLGPVPVPVSATPAVIDGLGVVVASDDGFVRCYNRSLTKVYWTRRLNSGVYASLVVDAERGRIVVAGTAGLVVCFDLRGTMVWATEVGWPVFATPVVLPGADVLVVATFHSRCVGLDLATGERLFERELPRPWHAEHGGVASHRDPYASPVATVDGNVVVCCAEHVVCLAQDGTDVWRTEVGHGIKASPAALHDQGEIAVCPIDGRCLFLSARTGALVAEIPSTGKVTASPAVSSGVLAVGTHLGDVSGVDVRTHDVVWTARQVAPRPYTSFSVLPSGDFIATTERGNVACLARLDGRLLWESSQVLGLAEHEPAMDITPVAGSDGRMYCAAYTGDLYEFRFRPEMGDMS